jgi:hypothetical protein
MIGRVKRWMNADNAIHTWLLRERVSNADVVLVLLFFFAVGLISLLIDYLFPLP